MPEGLLCLAGNSFFAPELYHSVGDLSQQELKTGSGVNPRLESLGYARGEALGSGRWGSRRWWRTTANDCWVLLPVDGDDLDRLRDAL